MAGGGISNGEGGGNLFTGDIVEKYEVNMEVSGQIKIFCGDSRVAGKVGYLENNAGQKMGVRVWL